MQYERVKVEKFDNESLASLEESLMKLLQIWQRYNPGKRVAYKENGDGTCEFDIVEVDENGAVRNPQCGPGQE